MENQNLDSPEGSPPGKRKLKKLILLLLVLVMLGGIGGGFYYWRAKSAAAAEGEETEEKAEGKSGKSKSKKSKESAADESEEEESEEAEVTRIIELQPFIVNLADEDQARYLRMTVSLGLGGEGGESEKPDPVFNTRVRDAILAVLSVKESEEILSNDGKAKLRKELLKAAQAVSGEAEVGAIYITEFIVQL